MLYSAFAVLTLSLPLPQFPPKQDCARADIAKMVLIFDAMTPEGAAPIIRQMVDAGKADLAAEILSRMKERSAARLIEAMNDPDTSALLLERMRKLKPLPVAPPPRLVK